MTHWKTNNNKMELKYNNVCFSVLLFTFYHMAHSVRVTPDSYLANSVKIYGGFRGAHESMRPHFAHLEMFFESTNSGKVYSCSGVVVSNRYVLTASHCVLHFRNKLAKRVSVCIGETYRRDCHWNYEAEAIFIPYHGGADPDMSIIRLSSSSGLSDLTLVTDDKLSKVGILYVSGAGRNERNENGIIETAEMHLFDSKSCQWNIDVINRQTSHGDQRTAKYVLCGVGGSSMMNLRTKCGICFGDSGGPLYQVINGSIFLLGISTDFTVTNFGRRISIFANVPIVSHSILHVMRHDRDQYWKKIVL